MLCATSAIELFVEAEEDNCLAVKTFPNILAVGIALRLGTFDD